MVFTESSPMTFERVVLVLCLLSCPPGLLACRLNIYIKAPPDRAHIIHSHAPDPREYTAKKWSHGRGMHAFAEPPTADARCKAQINEITLCPSLYPHKASIHM